MTYTCENMQELLNQYIDDFCTEDEKNMVESHISSCLLCNEYLNELKMMKTLLEDSRDFGVVLKPGFCDEVMKKVKDIDNSKKVLPFYQNKKVVSYLAAACAFVFVFIYANKNSFIGDIASPAPMAAPPPAPSTYTTEPPTEDKVKLESAAPRAMQADAENAQIKAFTPVMGVQSASAPVAPPLFVLRISATQTDDITEILKLLNATPGSETKFTTNTDTFNAIKKICDDNKILFELEIPSIDEFEKGGMGEIVLNIK